jgi:hypothetical protein
VVLRQFYPPEACLAVTTGVDSFLHELVANRASEGDTWLCFDCLLASEASAGISSFGRASLVLPRLRSSLLLFGALALSAAIFGINAITLVNLREDTLGTAKAKMQSQAVVLAGALDMALSAVHAVPPRIPSSA